jgi:hypothetical protein
MTACESPLRSVVRGCLTLALLAAASPALAQNLLANPHFDTTLTPWNMQGSVSFDSADANGSATSGSAKATDTLAAFDKNLVGVSQCVSGITAGASYDFGGKILLTTSPAGGGAALLVWWFPSFPCVGGPITVNESPIVTTLNSWLSTGGTAVAPAGAVAALVLTETVTQATPGDHTVNFDDLFLQLTAQVPTLDRPLLASLAALLAFVAVAALRRRRTA